MPKKTISIDEAFAALRSQGVNVKVIPPEDVETDEELAPFPAVKAEPEKVQETKVKGFKKVFLCSKHNISCTGDGDNAAQTVQYGPGECLVPVEYLAGILHQEQLARQCDARVFDPKPRDVIIHQVRNSSGHFSLKGTPLPEGISFDSVSDQYVISLNSR